MDQKTPPNAANAYGVLYERERAELEGCLQNIELFTKYITDYQCLRDRLTTLADKTSHEIMVPIAGSKMAFMPGYIHHTNEVLVLLGENYFAEKSTKEATEFVDRRIKFCKEKIQELETQKRMLENWLNVTEDVKATAESGLVDINEVWTEEELKQWKVKHRQRVQEHRKESARQGAHIDIDQVLAKHERNEAKAGEVVEAISQGGDARQKPPPQPSPTAVAAEQQLAGLSISERAEPAKAVSAPLSSAGNPSAVPSLVSGTPSSSAQSLPQRPLSKFKASRMANKE